ncbi:DNA-binding domain-containing protein [Shimia aestuarii]|uniref:Putative DNA-binding domain-containing protein n=1 Tax=Shimia aestuarii TaxID=254406 RepID=A0A1I4QN61_9RHOB|nr:DNA-binding domain-containing protein [Shimia aestuarii]SFM41145.1 Putative DNA-binding domain-containing protein [Shimia aestuarii]
MTVSQTIFRAALLDPDKDRPNGLEDAKGRLARKRFDVYRNNVAVSLTEALETGFPAITKLLGEENFKAISGVFLRQHPPSSPLMMHYGQEFPSFLVEFEPLAHLGYLGDVAALELALRRAYHAADAAPIDPATLAAITPLELSDVSFSFAPAVAIVTSDWPIYGIWAFNMRNGPKPTAKPESILVLRPAFDPEPHLLTPAEASCMRSLLGGATLGDAAEQAALVDTGFNLGPLLTQLLTGNAITKITTKN